MLKHQEWRFFLNIRFSMIQKMHHFERQQNENIRSNTLLWFSEKFHWVLNHKTGEKKDWFSFFTCVYAAFPEIYSNKVQHESCSEPGVGVCKYEMYFMMASFIMQYHCHCSSLPSPHFLQDLIWTLSSQWLLISSDLKLILESLTCPHIVSNLTSSRISLHS